MSIFSGLEKFGFSDEDDDFDLFEEEKPKKSVKKAETKKVSAFLDEKDLLLDKEIECPVCGMNFTTKVVRNTKLKRLEPDFDLRPNFENIDTLKYDVISCNHCGYTAMTRYFDQVTPGQRKMIKEAVCSKYKIVDLPVCDTYTPEFAVDRYKLALVNAVARKSKASEKAYICLKIAWIRRSEVENLVPKNGTEQAYLNNSKTEYESFYRKAYEGLLKALEKEMPPICGMDLATVEFILANMAMNYKEYDVASKFVSRLLTSSGTSKRIKDKCLDMKDTILKEIRKQH